MCSDDGALLAQLSVMHVVICLHHMQSHIVTQHHKVMVVLFSSFCQIL